MMLELFLAQKQFFPSFYFKIHLKNTAFCGVTFQLVYLVEYVKGGKTFSLSQPAACNLCSRTGSICLPFRDNNLRQRVSVLLWSG
jgi:hypothetical protein